jgi:hypothetical protein
MPRSHNLDRHGLTNTTWNWATPIPKRLRSLAYGEAGIIPLQVNQVQPLQRATGATCRCGGAGKSVSFLALLWKWL